jgi:hypothetical protein
MRKVVKRSLTIALFAIVSLLLPSSMVSRAQDKQKREFFQATAMGQSTQLGRVISINIYIEEYSTQEERQGLIQAFNSAGSKGLSNALDKMHAKGRLAITGTLGYDIAYIMSFPTETGRKIRIITNRAIRFGEVWADTRSLDYSLSAIELDLSNEKGKTTGILLPACQFKMNKENQLEIENYQNPWKLTNIMDR